MQILSRRRVHDWNGGVWPVIIQRETKLLDQKQRNTGHWKKMMAMAMYRAKQRTATKTKNSYRTGKQCTASLLSIILDFYPFSACTFLLVDVPPRQNPLQQKLKWYLKWNFFNAWRLTSFHCIRACSPTELEQQPNWNTLWDRVSEAASASSV